MADFSFFSDSDDEKAVQELLSQAKDHVVLEQLAAINCSGFTDSVLSTQLETRFQKLKSYPTSNLKSSSSLHTHSTSSFSSSNLPPVVISPRKQSKNTPFESKTESIPRTESHSGSDSEKNSVERNGLSPLKKDIFSPSKRNPDGEISKIPKSQLKCSSFEAKTESNSGSDSDKNSVERKSFPHSKFFKDDLFSPSKKNPDAKIAKNPKSQLKRSPFKAKTESNSGFGSDKNSVEKRSLPHSKLFQNDIFSPSKKNPDRKIAKESKSPSGSSSSRKSSTESTSSPAPQKSGFFWWLPSRASSCKKMSKENKRLGMGIDWEMEDELLSSDLNTFSAIKQKDLLKKAMKVEEKINREAEKIAKWSKQASAKS